MVQNPLIDNQTIQNIQNQITNLETHQTYSELFSESHTFTSVQQLVEIAKGNALRIVLLSWDNPITPDANNTIVFCGAWVAIALSYSGKIYMANDDTNNSWISNAQLVK